MLDSVRRIAELRGVVSEAKQEREALSAAIAALNVKKRSIDEAVETLEQTQKLTTSVSNALDRITARLDVLEGRASTLVDMDDRVTRLHADVTASQQVAAGLLGPEGALAKHQAIAEQLNAQETAARTNLDLITKERQGLDDMRDQLRQAGADVREAAAQFGAVKTEFEQLRHLGGQLGQDYGRMREASRDARDQAQAALDAVKETETRVASLRSLDDLARTARERINALNVLVEHVTQKARSMEAQKQTIEHAIVESNRLSELVWAMDAQVARLTDGMRQMTQAETVVDRLARAGQDAAAQLETAYRSRDAFLQDLGRLDQDRAALAEFIRRYHERMEDERRQLDQVETRVDAVQVALAAAEKSADELLARDRTIAAMAQQITGLEQQAASLGEGIGTLQQKQAALDGLRAQLADVEDFARRTVQQFDALKALRTDLGSLKQQMDEFHARHAEAAQMRDALDQNRLSFAAFLDRMDGFRALMPELDSRLTTIAGKLSVVDEGSQKASNLVALADNLDRQMTRILNNQKLVEKVESRINTLHTVATDVDRKVEEQLSRRTEIESLKNACDGVAVQVSDVQQKLEAVSAVQTGLMPLTAAVETLRLDVERSQTRLAEVRRDEAVIVEQEKKLVDLLATGRKVSDEVAATLKQVQGLTDELKRSATIKNEMVDELAAVQARQREVASNAAVANDQLTRLEAALAVIEQRRTQLVFMERTIAAFDGRLGQLKGAAEDVDRRIEAVGARMAVVDAVKRDVDGVRDLAARSKADLEAVDARRSEIAAIGHQVDAILSLAAKTQEQLGRVEARKREVDEIDERTGLIVSMLEDVRVNLELVNEQKAVVDHVAQDLAKLDSLVRSGQRALKALQAERELAERIERSIKALRARGTTADEDSSKKLA